MVGDRKDLQLKFLLIYKYCRIALLPLYLDPISGTEATHIGDKQAPWQLTLILTLVSFDHPSVIWRLPLVET